MRSNASEGNFGRIQTGKWLSTSGDGEVGMSEWHRNE